jgi:hypothetical protein
LGLVPLATLPLDAADGSLVILLSGGLYKRTGGIWAEIGPQELTYTNPSFPTLTTVIQALDYLLSGELVGQTFAVSPSQVEVGYTVTSLTMSWSWNKSVSSQTLVGVGATALLAGDRSASLSGLSVTNTTSWQLTGYDEVGSALLVATLPFRNRRFWGVVSMDNPTPDDIPSSELSSGRTQSRNLEATDQYLVFSWPSSYGTPVFLVNGFLNTAWVKTTAAWVNAYGVSTSYDTYRSLYKQTAVSSDLQVAVT